MFHVEAFMKVCGILNRVHQERQTDWDLRVPAGRWAYRAMCKNLSTKMILKLRSRVETIILEEKNPTVGIVHEDRDEGIM